MTIEIVVMNIEEAKKIDLVDYMLKAGYALVKQKGNDFWFKSPFRNEKTASFKVNQVKNVWYDHGEGVGGDILHLIERIHHCDISHALKHLSTGTTMKTANSTPIESPSSGIIILAEKPLQSKRFFEYLKDRQIDSTVAQQYCSEITCQNNDKVFKAIGFKNDAGGFELRNEFIKLSTAPKTCSTFDKGLGSVAVFEGFFDFLSYQTIIKDQNRPQQDYCVLNSIGSFDKARAFLEQHTSIQLYMDNDAAGEKMTKKAVALSPNYTDESIHYRPYKDVNDWLVAKNAARSADNPKLSQPQNIGNEKYNCIKPKR